MTFHEKIMIEQCIKMLTLDGVNSKKIVRNALKDLIDDCYHPEETNLLDKLDKTIEASESLHHE